MDGHVLDRKGLAYNCYAALFELMPWCASGMEVVVLACIRTVIALASTISQIEGLALQH